MRTFLAVALAALACSFRPPEAKGDAIAILVGKLLTVDDSDQVFSPGMLLVEAGKIRYVGAPVEVPEGYRSFELARAWAAPGMVDLHTHIHTGGWGDINDMVNAVNPEYRTSPTIRPGNNFIQRGCAGGVTTLFGIPGSGTNISGFGVLYKSKSGPAYEDAVLADPGGMKVAQDSNPQRRAGDFGATRAGMGWILEDVNDRAIAAARNGGDPALDQLSRVHSGELPVLIHTAGSQGVVNTARMWRERYGTRAVLSHGSFDGWKAALAVAATGMPVNHGPRTMDFVSSRNGRINGSGAAYIDAGVPLFSLNTDSGVVPQEELFLQGAMTARYGAEPYQMLRALTIHPAKAFGIDDRVGSLEPGKDADIVIYDGDPIDPRSAVQLVFIDGAIEYDRNEGPLF
jgi:imidazolonepropionase-like amidohydrolase